MFSRIPEPKEIVEYPGQHCEILSHHFPEIIARSARWTARPLENP